MDAVILAVIAAIVLWAEWRTTLTFDGERYLRGDLTRPFGFRLIGAQILQAVGEQGRHILAVLWVFFTVGVVYAHAGLLPTVLFLGLANVRTILRAPALVDGPVLALVTIAWFDGRMDPWYAALFGLVAGIWSERAPVLMAAASLNPWFLVGLAIPLGLWRHTRPMEPLQAPIVRDLNWQTWIAPWGLALPGFLYLSLEGWIFVAGAYAQCLVATDRARLFQVAAAPVVIAAGAFYGDALFPLVAAVHLCLPSRRML